MASSIIILKPVDRYLPEQAVRNFKKAVVGSGMFLKKIEIEYDVNKKFLNAEGGIEFVENDELKQFHFTINDIDEYSEESFEWLLPGKGMFWAIDIEDIGECHRQVYDFATEYFFENKNDYLWLDSLRWAYSADEINKLSHLPYNPMWLYKKLI